MLTVFLAVLALLLALTGLLLLLQRGGSTHRLDRARALRTLEDVVAGTATGAEWTVFMGLPVRHDPMLIEIRLRCLDIEHAHFVGEGSFRGPHLFDREGLRQIELLLRWLRKETGSRVM